MSSLIQGDYTALKVFIPLCTPVSLLISYGLYGYKITGRPMADRSVNSTSSLYRCIFTLKNFLQDAARLPFCYFTNPRAFKVVTKDLVNRLLTTFLYLHYPHPLCLALVVETAFEDEREKTYD